MLKLLFALQGHFESITESDGTPESQVYKEVTDVHLLDKEKGHYENSWESFLGSVPLLPSLPFCFWMLCRSHAHSVLHIEFGKQLNTKHVRRLSLIYLMMQYIWKCPFFPFTNVKSKKCVFSKSLTLSRKEKEVLVTLRDTFLPDLPVRAPSELRTMVEHDLN